MRPALVVGRGTRHVRSLASQRVPRYGDFQLSLFSKYDARHLYRAVEVGRFFSDFLVHVCECVRTTIQHVPRVPRLVHALCPLQVSVKVRGFVHARLLFRYVDAPVVVDHALDSDRTPAGRRNCRPAWLAGLRFRLFCFASRSGGPSRLSTN